ncbi:MAG: hypothetical protein IKD90_02905 [Clostridiales bacterium]|nr:hypothetical protein [Clostridiales bacterium]
MNEHQKKNLNRFEELAARARSSGIYTFSTFHSRETASLAYEVASEKEVMLWGGTDNCERVVARFGDPDEIGYSEDFPICILCVKPKQAKYADSLTHRDFLGAILNLGIERDMLGDILVHENSAYFFVIDKVSDVIRSDLDRVKHTAVSCSVVASVPEDCLPKLSEEHITVFSPRLDAILAKVYHLSREDAKTMFDDEKVTLNGRLCRNPETLLKENTTVSVRGYGKMEYHGEEYTTKKGKTGLTIWRYI